MRQKFTGLFAVQPRLGTAILRLKLVLTDKIIDMFADGFVASKQDLGDLFVTVPVVAQQYRLNPITNPPIPLTAMAYQKTLSLFRFKQRSHRFV